MAQNRMNENIISEKGPEREVHSKIILPFSHHNLHETFRLERMFIHIDGESK